MEANDLIANACAEMTPADRSASLTDVSIDGEGAVHLGFATDTGDVKLCVPKEKATDALRYMLFAFAHAAERPGPHYQSMLLTEGVETELVHPARGPAIPSLALRLSDKTRLRVALQPEEILRLGRDLEALAWEIQKPSR